MTASVTHDTSLWSLVPGHCDHAQTAGLRFAFHWHDDPRIDDADDLPTGLGLFDVMREADKSARQYFDRSHAGYEYIHNDIRLYEFHSDFLPFPDCPFRLALAVGLGKKFATSVSDNLREAALTVNEYTTAVTPKAQVQ